LPDGGFLRQILEILSGKNISAGLLISDGFLADWTKSGFFVWWNSGGFGVSTSKKQFFLLFWLFLAIFFTS
jgi:hypothetical protein